MKSFVAASILALVGASAAAPSTLRYAKRTSPNGCGGDPGQVGVVDAINSWNNDVTTVNDFLDLAATSNNDPSTIAAHIGNVINSASDEPNQLQVLACESDLIPGSAAQNAVDDLFTNFQSLVLVPLGNIMADPNDSDSVASNLATINLFRCCSVLPDLDALWEFDADDEGVSNQVPISAPRPGTCASISC